MLRKHKDCEITKMIRLAEEERHKTSHEISDLKETILAKNHEINEKNSKILSLEEYLNKKADVELQLQEAQEREEENKRGR